MKVKKIVQTDERQEKATDINANKYLFSEILKQEN